MAKVKASGRQHKDRKGTSPTSRSTLLSTQESTELEILTHVKRGLTYWRSNDVLGGRPLLHRIYHLAPSSTGSCTLHIRKYHAILGQTNRPKRVPVVLHWRTKEHGLTFLSFTTFHEGVLLTVLPEGRRQCGRFVYKINGKKWKWKPENKELKRKWKEKQ